MEKTLRERIVPWRLIVSAAVMLLCLMPIAPLQGYADEVAQVSVQAHDKVSAIGASTNGQANAENNYDEDLVAGMRLKSAGSGWAIGPYRHYSTVQDPRRGDRIYSRSMRSIDNSIREMRTNLNRIRTYNRLFR